MDEVKDTLSEIFHTQLEKAFLEVTRNDRDFSMMAYRFGIYDRKWYTLQETCEIFSLSRERVRQIQNKIVRRIKTFGKKTITQRLFNSD
jgi:DNA-directed RNA polymerase, sigma subunit (sigma70/sigma32)